MKITKLLMMILVVLLAGCDQQTQNNATTEQENDMYKFMVLDPGHFHAYLVLKKMYENVSDQVYLFAPEGAEANDWLDRIRQYNSRTENPTNWEVEVYLGDDFIQQMIESKPGDVMVTAGNNMKKTEYIKQTVDAGINVLADKPMAINTDDFELLVQAFESAEQNDVLLYDIMTERYEITTMMQKEFSQIPAVFGELQTGSPEDPAVTKESVHHFFKYVSGSPLQRPGWFFDVEQQGEGIVDVTTHLVDLVQWECYPEQVIDYNTDIELVDANRWPTELDIEQFTNVTGEESFPDYLQKDVEEGILNVYSNGEIIYKINDTYAKVSVIWNYQAPEGAGDTHYSIMKGSKANLVIRQGEDQNFKPELYIEPVEGTSLDELETEVTTAINSLSEKYSGLSMEMMDDAIHIQIPAEFKVGHEAHFAQVAEKYLGFLENNSMPEWEVPNMITKYYITTQGLKMAKEDQNL